MAIQGQIPRSQTVQKTLEIPRELWTYQWKRGLVMLNTRDHVAQSATVMRKRSLIFLLSVATVAVQTQTTENLADESLYFSGEAASGSQMMTQEVMVPVAGLTRVLGRSVREPVVQADADH